jgi:Ca2+-transporting ATPase
LGRRIFANLRRALTFITAVHVPIAGLALAPVLMGLPPLLMPMHVVLLELVIDPMCALVFEGEPSDKDAMRRPPRKADEPLFGLNHIIAALAQGLALLFAVLGLYLWASHQGMSAVEARAMAFTALIVAALALALGDSMSSAGLFAPHRRTYWVIAAAVAAVLALILMVPPLASIFDMAPLAPGALLLAVVVGAASAAVARFMLLLRGSRRAISAAPS